MASRATGVAQRVLAAPPQRDLHPDDATHRANIHQWIHDHLAATTLTRQEINALAGATAVDFPNYCRRSRNLTLPSIQRIVRGLGYTLYPYLDTSALTGWGPIPTPSEPIIASLFHGDKDRYDEAIRLHIGMQHKAVREHLNLTPVHAAMRSRTDANQMRAMEEGATQRWALGNIQRLFRALGAPLYFAVENVASGALERIPYETPAVTETPASGLVRVARTDDTAFVWHSRRPEHILMFTSQEWQQFIDNLVDIQ